MALQPNYILAGQRAGMGPPFRKNQNQIKKISSVGFPFSSEALILGFRVLECCLSSVMARTLDGVRQLHF